MPRKVTDVSSDEVIDEKKILKEAEEREKEREALEEKERAEAKEAKAEAKAEERAERAAHKQVQARKKPRHGKKYRELAKEIEKGKEYSVIEAIELVLKTSPAKFDATVEVHAKVNDKEKNIRGTVTLPGGIAKEKRILAVTEKNVDEVIDKVKKGEFDFDLMVADMKLMPRMASVAKILGPKGLMPSPKAGTAVDDVEKAVDELKGGKVEYRVDKTNVIHLALGKVSFGADRIKQNYDALIGHLPKRIDSIYLTTTMGPSVKVVKK